MSVVRPVPYGLLEYGSLQVDPVCYEIVWFGRHRGRVLSGFPDVHVVEEPVWRLVAGYLMLSGTSPGSVEDGLEVAGHGRRVCRLGIEADGSVTVRFDTPPSSDGQVLRSGEGIAVVADAGSTICVGADRCVAVVVSRDPDRLGFTFVHGPDAGKVENRIGLLRSLRRLEGDHG